VSKGQHYPAENRETTDAASGRRIRQITSHPSIHHHPFFFVRAYDAAMKRLIFVSYRTGKPQIFFENRASGELVLTNLGRVGSPILRYRTGDTVRPSQAACCPCGSADVGIVAGRELRVRSVDLVAEPCA